MYGVNDKDYLIRSFDEQTRVNLIKKDALKQCIEILKPFDGKIVNVKMDRALQQIQDAYFTLDKHPIEKDVIKFTLTVIKVKDICTMNGYRMFEVAPKVTMYALQLKEGRFIHADFEQKANDIIKSIEQQNETYAKDKERIDEIEKEYLEICQAIQKFNKSNNNITKRFMNFDNVY